MLGFALVLFSCISSTIFRQNYVLAHAALPSSPTNRLSTSHPIDVLKTKIDEKVRQKMNLRLQSGNRKTSKPLSPEPMDKLEKKIAQYLYQKVYLLNDTNEREKFRREMATKLPKRQPLRQQPQPTRRYISPPDMENKQRIVNIEMQAIYTTQERMRSMENITRKYANDVRYRAAFVFAKLQQLRDDLHTIYTISLGHYTWRVKFFIIYYSHMMKKNIDITYIVEYLINMHEMVVANKGKNVQFKYVPYESIDGMDFDEDN